MQDDERSTTMKYALLIYRQPGDVDALSDAERASHFAEYLKLRDEQPGMLAGAGLHDPDTATTVRLENGKPLVVDGPFADTKEYLAGYYVIEAADLDAAVDVAARVPAARVGGAVEIRPVLPELRNP
jgi:hypothetical protein